MKYAQLLAVGSAIALAVAAQPASAQPAEGEQAAAANSEEIIVTAQRREQTLFEVPQSISVVGGEELERQQAKSFLDYAALVPGLNVVQDNPGQSRLVLRGINTGSVGSTVAVYVDDVPFGSSGSLSNAAILSGDFDTFDVARIEVLRGPQGTLYGANSLGGVLKYVTALPQMTSFETRAQAGVESTAHGGTGYLGNALVNVPISDMLAFRASGFYHKTAGYVDVVGRGGKDVDESESYGGRASLLFEPTTDFSVRLFALAQNIRVDSPSSFTVDPLTLRPVHPVTGLSTGADERLRYERITEFHDIDYRLYSGTIDWNVGFAALTSITSYSTQKQDQISDISTNAARGLAGLIYGGAAPNSVGLAFRNNASVKKFTEEVRLVSPTSNVFDWVAGVYYTHEKTGLDQEFLPFTLSSQAFIPPTGTFGPFTFTNFVVAGIDAKYEEVAGYATGTLHLGPRFDITAGGRYSHNKQSSSQAVIQLGNGSPVFGDSSQGVFTWSVSPRFEVSDNVAVYARAAKGYRPGGPNFIPAGAPADFPAEFDADTLVSYEAGIKAETPDRSFGVDASLFYVDWDNILILAVVNTDAGPVGINANGRRARSYGGEGTVTVRPMSGLNLVATLAYTKANLTDDTTPTDGAPNLSGGLAGDELPYTPHWTANLSADYDWDLASGAEAYVGGSVRLQGDQKAGFGAAYRAAFGKQIEIDGYATVDLRAGVDFGRFSVQAYVRNLFDQYGVVNAGGYPFAVPADIGGAGVPLLTASTIRPRTIGGTVGFEF